MDYERIHKVQQMGVISPSKLRMKLLGVHNSRKKEGGSNSSRTSPSKLEEMEYAKNHLLTPDFDEGVSSKYSKSVGDSVEPNLEIHSKSRNNAKTVTYQVQSSNGLRTVHPERALEEDGNVYDSGHENGSTCTFEFHRGERSLHHHHHQQQQHQASGPFFRHVPSKWNDAEKWIVNRQPMSSNAMKSKNLPQGQGISHQTSSSNWGRDAQEMNAADTKRIDSTVNPISQNVVAKFSFVPHSLQPNLVFSSGMSEPADLSQEDHKASVSGKPSTEFPVVPTVESVSMRDVGTEMTPIPSQEPSRTGTPMGATTPSRSPRSSNPSTPKREHAAPPSKVHEHDCKEKGGKPELSEKELKLKTRKEIADLGMKLGKMNIASWASKEAELASSSPKNVDVEQDIKAENEARAAAWEEAEKAKHMARYRREEVKIQAWESHQKAKFEAKMRKLEVRLEEMRGRTQERIARKLGETRRQVEERRAGAEAHKNHKAAQTAQKAELIRQTGRLPLSHIIRCCSWFM